MCIFDIIKCFKYMHNSNYIKENYYTKLFGEHILVSH